MGLHTHATWQGLSREEVQYNWPWWQPIDFIGTQSLHTLDSSALSFCFWHLPGEEQIPVRRWFKKDEDTGRKAHLNAQPVVSPTGPWPEAPWPKLIHRTRGERSQCLLWASCLCNNRQLKAFSLNPASHPYLLTCELRLLIRRKILREHLHGSSVFGASGIIRQTAKTKT